MLILTITFIICFGVGAFSAYYTTAFYKLLIFILSTLAVLSTYFLRLGFVASYFGEGSLNPFLVYWIGFKSVPEAVQNSVMLFPLFIITGRLVTWIFMTYFETEVIESEDEKRERLLSEFGWEDIRKPKSVESEARQTPSLNQRNRKASFGKRL